MAANPINQALRILFLSLIGIGLVSLVGGLFTEAWPFGSTWINLGLVYVATILEMLRQARRIQAFLALISGVSLIFVLYSLSVGAGFEPWQARVFALLWMISTLWFLLGLVFKDSSFVQQMVDVDPPDDDDDDDDGGYPNRDPMAYKKMDSGL